MKAAHSYRAKTETYSQSHNFKSHSAVPIKFDPLTSATKNDYRPR